MIRIKKFKLDGKYKYCIDYERITYAGSIETNDEPKSSLFSAIGKVTSDFVEFAGLDLSSHVISFSSVTYADDNTALEFIFMPRISSSMKMILKSGRISLSDVLDKNRESDPDHPRNILNISLTHLKDELAAYVNGERAQKDMDFDNAGAPEE